MYVKKEVAECPTCGATVDIIATECPECGELFAEDIDEVVEELDEYEEEELNEYEEEKSEPEEIEELTVPKEKTHGRTLFFMGIVIAIIGVGAAFSSLLHDWLRIPIIGTAYDAIGWLNRSFIAVGLIILVIGIIFLIFSLRSEKGKKEEEIEEAEEEE